MARGRYVNSRLSHSLFDLLCVTTMLILGHYCKALGGMVEAAKVEE